MEFGSRTPLVRGDLDSSEILIGLLDSSKSNTGIDSAAGRRVRVIPSRELGRRMRRVAVRA